MSDTKFTPGPCSVHDANGNMSIVHNNSMLTLAFMVGTDIFTGEGFDLKYAHLFAAAPDMYEALKIIAGQFECHACSDCTNIARTAIAKAEGKA